MRSAKATEGFPYDSNRICYMELFPTGEINQLITYGEKFKDTCVPRMAPANSLQCGLVIGTVICSSLMTWKRSALVKDY